MKRDFINCGIIGAVVVLLIIMENRETEMPSTPMLNIIQIPNLEEIEVNFACQLYIQQGDDQKIAIEGGSQMIDQTGLQMKGGKLIFRRSGFLHKLGIINSSTPETLTIYVTLKDIDQIYFGEKGKKISAYNGGNRLSVKIGDTGAQIFIKT